MSRRAWQAVLALGVLTMLAAAALFLLAIWTVGPDSARLCGTGFLVGVIGFITAFAGGVGADQ